MNPALISALGRQRDAELLHAQQFRDSQRQWRQGSESATRRTAVTRRPVTQLRRSLGSVLVVAGTRLMTTNQVTVD